MDPRQTHVPETAAPLDRLCVVVDGLRDGPASSAVVETVRQVAGVKRVFVSYPMETMYLAFDPVVTTAATVRAAVLSAAKHVEPDRRRP